jgi:transcriptional regulator with XRE-family HTH domain
LLPGFLAFVSAVVVKHRHRKALGESIRSYRKRAGMSQEKLAEKADLHHNYVGELERGEKAASIDSLLKIARALRIKVRDLVAQL